MIQKYWRLFFRVMNRMKYIIWGDIMKQNFDELFAAAAERGGVTAQKPGESRRDYLSRLRDNSHKPSYEDALGNMNPSWEDLEALFPRDKIPPLSVASHTYTRKFLSVIEYISKNDPDFWDIYPKEKSEGVFIGGAIALYLMGEKMELAKDWIGQVRDMNSFLGIGSVWAQQMEGNKYYPFDARFRNGVRDLVDAYVRYRLPEPEDDEIYVANEALDPVLRFAAQVVLDGRTLEFINTKYPIPESVVDMHVTGMESLTRVLCYNAKTLSYFAVSRENFSTLSPEEKGTLAQSILDMLSEAYGVHPAPSFDWDATSECYGEHRRRDTNKLGCFHHPLGRVYASPHLFTSFEGLLETLCHEFCHGLEDLSQLVLNPDFQKWFHESGEREGVRIGLDSLQTDLKASGLAFAFNSAGNATHPAFNGDGQDVPYYRHGDYYSSDHPSYKNQLRERHAYFMESELSCRVNTVLNFQDHNLDPIVGIKIGQAMYSPIIEALHSLQKERPDSMKADILEACMEIEACFDEAGQAGASHATSLDRLYEGLRLSLFLFRKSYKQDFDDGISDNSSFWTFERTITDILDAIDILKVYRSLEKGGFEKINREVAPPHAGQEWYP